METVTSVTPAPMLIKVSDGEISNVHYTVNIVDHGEIRAYRGASGYWYQLFDVDRKREDEQVVRYVQVNFSDREEPGHYYGKEAELIWTWYVSMVVTDLTLDNNS